MKHRYVAFGLNIESEFELPGADRGSVKGNPSVSIRKARPEDVQAGLSDKSDGGDFLFLRVQGTDLYYWVEGGESITFLYTGEDKQEGEDLIKVMALGFAFSVLLRQRGLLPLHGCVLSGKGKTFAFVGDSGWGKSTLAEFFSQQGYELLNEDVAALKVHQGSVLAIPGHPIVKLRPQSSALVATAKEGDEHHDFGGRLFVSKKRDAVGIQQLDHIFLLEKEFADHVDVVPLGKSDVVMSLIQHCHGSHLFHRSDYREDLLEKCRAVASLASVGILRKRYGLGSLPEVLEVVEGELGLSSD